MKTAKKALLLTVCALVLVAATVFGTVAYLTAEDEVVNTFTSGKVMIELDEAKVNEDLKIVDKDGNVVTDPLKAERVKNNKYHVLPGTKVTKDPIVHVDPASESAYLYVTIDNQMAPAVDTAYLTEQAKLAGWKELTGVKDANGNQVYWMHYVKGQDIKDFAVFTGFKVDFNADNDTMKAVDGKTIIVNAYAIQSMGWTPEAEPGEMVRPFAEGSAAGAAYAWETANLDAPELA